MHVLRVAECGVHIRLWGPKPRVNTSSRSTAYSRLMDATRACEKCEATMRLTEDWGRNGGVYDCPKCGHGEEYILPVATYPPGRRPAPSRPKKED